MPLRLRNGYGMSVLPINQLLRLGQGYETINGCATILADNSSDIELSVASGSVRHEGEEVSVSAQNPTLADGDPNNPRRDLVWIDRFGDANILAGEAREPSPSGEERQTPWSPPPPDAAGLDGVPIAEVWVPTNASSSDDLVQNDVIDRRVGGSVYSARVPELSSDPDREDLWQSRMWLNTSANSGSGELRFYNSAADEIQAISTTQQQDFTTVPAVTVEEFTEESIEGNWVDGDSHFDHRSSPVVVGSESAWTHDEWPIVHKYSMPGDGLSRYPEPGDAIRMHVRRESGESPTWVNIGFAKEEDTRAKDYRVELNWDKDELELYRVGELIPDHTTLETTSNFSTSADAWYVIEIEYDGAGTGQHAFRIYDTDTNDDRNTVLDEVTNPTQDTNYRGRGIAIRTSGTGTGMDNLVVDAS